MSGTTLLIAFNYYVHVRENRNIGALLQSMNSILEMTLEVVTYK